MRLENGRFLYLYQRLGLRHAHIRPDDHRFLTTLEYKYQYQETEDDETWIFRYEYQREPPSGYPYPRIISRASTERPALQLQRRSSRD